MKACQWTPISRNEGTLLRALAILAIVFHNYLHWISDLPGENEFNYRPERVQAFLDALCSTPADAVRLFATYLGHYGVQVFFFLSGYGLSIKYRDTTPRWLDFQKKRWFSLYPAILTSALGYLAYESIRLGWHHVFATEGLNLIRQMLGIANFIPDNIYHPIGPWWFIGVILQFYLIAPSILKWTRHHGTPLICALVAGSWTMEWFCGPLMNEYFNLNINHTILGHLDTCAVGILAARNNTFSIPRGIMAVAAVLFLLGNFFPALWVTTGASLLIVGLPLLRGLIQKIQSFPRLINALMGIGQLSMYIFLCNGYLRRPLVEWAQSNAHWWTSIWTSLIFLTGVLLWSIMLRASEKGIRRRLQNKGAS